MEKIDVSIVIPARDEEESILELVDWISRVMQAHDFSYEVIFIDDGSTDSTWQKIVEASQANTSIKGLRFNRNFGKAAALNTGFQAAKGDVIVTMDADLQDSPDEIPELYGMIMEQGFDLVSGWKRKRHDPVTKTIPSKFFNFLTRKMSGLPLHDFNCGLKAYHRRVTSNISVYGEMHRYIPVIAKWAGFTRITEKEVVHRERKYGNTKYGWTRIRGMLDLITVTFVGRFARRPMHFFGTLGAISFLVGFVFTVKIFWEKMDSLFFSHEPLRREVVEQPIFYLALVAIVIGVQLFLTGFLAELIARQSLSKKDYLVIETTGVDEKQMPRVLLEKAPR